jgi:flavodoxin
LWINLWIRGVKPVDKSVDKIVDNSSLWITRHLSTICPQENAGYPQFLPQARLAVIGLGKTDFGGYPHIHRPYYYYYSNKDMFQ